MAVATSLIACFPQLTVVYVLASGSTLKTPKTKDSGLSQRHQQHGVTEVSVGLFEVVTTVDCVLKPELPAVRSG